jgi:hypothetical protein
LGLGVSAARVGSLFRLCVCVLCLSVYGCVLAESVGSMIFLFRWSCVVDIGFLEWSVSCMCFRSWPCPLFVGSANGEMNIGFQMFRFAFL